MNAAVHTSTRVHRCRDDVPRTSAICLTTPSGGRCHDGCGQQAFPVKRVLTSLQVIMSALAHSSDYRLQGSLASAGVRIGHWTVQVASRWLGGAPTGTPAGARSCVMPHCGPAANGSTSSVLALTPWSLPPG